MLYPKAPDENYLQASASETIRHNRDGYKHEKEFAFVFHVEQTPGTPPKLPSRHR